MIKRTKPLRRKPAKSTRSSTASRAFKKRSIPVLQKELDRIFSIFIRMRDSNEQGIIRCITCGAILTFRTAQCGHFWSRRHISVRWDEQNTASQCVKCNIFDQGANQKFASALQRKYGESILQILEIRKNNVCKMSQFQYEILIKEYQSKVRQLEGAR